MVRVGNLSVRLIDSSTQRAFPEVSHGGMTYVVCQSGADYHVEAQSHCGHRTKGVITVDGDLVDYRCNISIGRGPTSFYGFPLRERDAHGKKRFRAFQFSHTQIAEPGSAAAAKAAKADDDDDSMVGTVLFELFPAEKTAQKTKKHRAGSGSGFCGGGGGDKLVKKKGGNFAAMPSLATQQGGLSQHSSRTATHKWVFTSQAPCDSVLLRPETLETLRGRGVPVNPQLMADFFSGAGAGAGAGAGGGGGASPASSSPAGEAGGGGVRRPVKKQKTMPQAPPVTIDLCDSDDEEAG